MGAAGTVTQPCAELLVSPGGSTGAEPVCTGADRDSCKALCMRKVLRSNQDRTAWMILFQNLVMRTPSKPHRSWCCLHVLPYRAHQLRCGVGAMGMQPAWKRIQEALCCSRWCVLTHKAAPCPQLSSSIHQKWSCGLFCLGSYLATPGCSVLPSCYLLHRISLSKR